MATERLPMRNIREILRLKWTLRRSHRDTARSLGISAGTVASVVTRAKAMALTWDTVVALSDDALERTLYGPKLALTVARPGPDLVWMHTELRRPGVTLELLHLEYLAAHPDGYRYSAFCGHYRRWLAGQRCSMRQIHKAGDKTFVDYAGQRPHVVDQTTGVCTAVELFVAVLGASNYTYAEASRTQRSGDFIQSHTRALEYFGGVSAVIVPDQLRTGVTEPCRYEPTIQRTYEDWARHYGTAILPARPAKPRDKAKVEVAVQVVERWILARLRNETFFTLVALNGRIAELLEDLNARPMKGYGGASRRALFDRFDRPALQPLPSDRYVHAEWRHARVNIDYHVEVDRHYYSVPHALIHTAVEIRLTATTVDVLLRGARVWLHVRSFLAGRHTTIPAHMPKAHRAHLEWSPSRLIRWGATIGRHTEALVTTILEHRPHPEQGYRSCLGLLRLAKQHGPERLDAACARAVAAGARSYRHVESILKHGLDRLPLDAAPAPPNPRPPHDNVRGPAYYDQPDAEGDRPC
jgi:transposase